MRVDLPDPDGPDDADHLAFGHLQVDLRQGREGTVVLRQVADLYDAGHQRVPCPMRRSNRDTNATSGQRKAR